LGARLRLLLKTLPGSSLVVSWLSNKLAGIGSGDGNLAGGRWTYTNGSEKRWMMRDHGKIICRLMNL
jgi:hypothetical protein